jgi:MoaA/NifB/PqqE/SkfB family radical SAM enzyme
MANILLTTRCNLRCPYCFAQEKLGSGQKLTMAMGDVEKVIAFLKRSNHPYFRAMGGEPTLHPEFPAILEMALKSGMRVDLLSNATWPEDYNGIFRRTSPRRVFFLLNVDRPERYAQHIWERIEHNLAAIADRGSVTLSFNVFEKQPAYEYVLDLTRQYGINKIRMSFSLPVVGADNACLKLEDYKEMAPFVVEFARRAEELGVQVRMDNAVPLCMFNNEQAGELLIKGVVDLNRNMRCEPVIDIGPDLSVWCCFCLSKLWNRHLDEFQTLQEAQAFYRRAMSLYQSRLYPLAECDECRYREQWNCQGGCLTHSVLRHGELSLEDQPEQPCDDGWKEGTVLALAPDVEIRFYDMPEESFAILSKTSGMELELEASHKSLLQSLNGQCSAREIVERYVQDGARESCGMSELAALTDGALRQGANELLHGMVQQGLVVEQQI